MARKQALTFTATIRHENRADETMTLAGRDAWALLQLWQAGAAGCTPITHPGPRWSSYVHKLRGKGFVIETVHETHRGPFQGHHARYILHSTVTLEGGTLDQWLAQRSAA